MFCRKSLTAISKLYQIRSIQTAVAAPSSHSAPAILEYKPLPLSGTFVLDYRRDRQIIEDGYIPKGANFSIRFELLDENDYEFMTQYVTEHFVKESNVCRHLQLKGDELIELIQQQVIQWISCKNSVLVKHDEKIIGTALGSLHTREEFNDLFRGELFHDNPKFVIKKDYAEDIRNGPFKSHNLNRLGVLLEELMWQTGKFLPKDIQKLAMHELAAIHPKYSRYGLATKGAETLQKIMVKQGCTHEVGYSVALGTYKMSKKFGHHTLYSLPYDQFLENGKPVFHNLFDNAIAGYATFLDYKKDKIGRKD
uniref:N-acetyltransferase domain-containing protein n=1 Tax=Panagrolaimus superbus TaxID=310955 RepID=A0A914YU17_9BILA